MIIVKLMGGLGNQMFQYAIGRRLAMLNDVPLKADLSFLMAEGLSHTKRHFELDVFELKITIVTSDELQKFTTIQKSSVKSRFQKYAGFLFPYFTVSEPYHQYDPRILQSPKNSLLIGFWQTEKYFLPIEEAIRKDFVFKNPLDKLNSDLSKIIIGCEAVSLHVRRGDYANNKETHSFHGECSVGYYLKAIETMRQKFPEMQLFVFSDDSDWARKNIVTDVPVTYIENNSGNSNYIDMQLMSMCKHNIIANSSFSWWGAWLNNNPVKIVIAPGKWFNDPSVNTKDVIPAGWIKL